MFIHCLIILHGFSVVYSSAHNRSESTTLITTDHSHSDVLLQWLRRSFSTIQVHLHIVSSKCNSEKNHHARGRLYHLISGIHHRNNRLSRKLFHQKNQTTNSNVGSMNQSRFVSTNANRVVKTTDINILHANRTRKRRDFLRGNNIDDEDDTNVYDDDDNGRYYRNQEGEIAVHKQGFGDEYYLPTEKKFQTKDNNRLYEDAIVHVNRHGNERNTNKRFMQNHDELLDSDRLSNDDNLHNDHRREYLKMNAHGDAFDEKDLDDSQSLREKQRHRYVQNDYFDQLEKED